MDSDSNYTASVVVPDHVEAGHAESPELVDISGHIMLLTWVCFGIMLLVLYKVAWKPILKLVAQREESIRKALDAAEKARRDCIEAEAKSKQVIQDAQAEGGKIVSAARAESERAAAAIGTQAKEDASAMIKDARREIANETQKAMAALRTESAELAVKLAGRIIRENMDTDRNRKLVEEFAGDLKTN